METGITAWVSQWAGIKADEIALVFKDQRVTWSELDIGVSRTANALIDAGLEPGERVGCLMHNSVEFLQVLLGTIRAGGVFVPLNTFFSAPELAYVLEDSGAAVVVTDADFAAVVGKLTDPEVVRTWVSARGEIPVPHLRLAEIQEAASAEVPEIQHGWEDLVALYYTSGTSGRPKGAMISHANAHFATLNWLVDLGFDQTDRFLLTMPLCFTGAIVVALPALHAGATLYLEPGFDPGRVVGLIGAERISFFVGVPTMATALMADPAFETSDLSSLRTMLIGAAPVSDHLFDTYLKRGVAFISSFGMTEVSGGFAMITPIEQASEKRGTAGRPCLYTAAKVVGPDGLPVPDGEIGELLLSGPLICGGYWRNPDETAKTIIDGWLHTGDLAIRSEDGFYRIVDRMKDMIITGGLNVYPAEVENALASLPEVRESVVFGFPDDHWGQRVAASILLEEGATLTQEELKARLGEAISSYKIPTVVDFREQALPRTASGKFLRRVVKDELITSRTTGEVPA